MMTSFGRTPGCGRGRDGPLLGAQLVGRRGTEIAKRVDIYATVIYRSYTPPLGSPRDAIQMAAQAWVRDHEPTPQQQAMTRT